MSTVEDAVAALRRGELVVIPTDTVYGLAADGEREPSARALYAAKGRAAIQPTALVFGSIAALLARLPELPDESVGDVEALLPGPLTLVLPNPARRYAWLNAENPAAIGVRVPQLTGPASEILAAVPALVATSANLPGEPDPRRVHDVPERIARAAAAVVDGGRLPGKPSTVVDLTGAAPRVLREGALPAAEVLERLRAARDR